METKFKDQKDLPLFWKVLITAGMIGVILILICCLVHTIEMA